MKKYFKMKITIRAIVTSVLLLPSLNSFASQMIGHDSLEERLIKDPIYVEDPEVMLKNGINLKDNIIRSTRYDDKIFVDKIAANRLNLKKGELLLTIDDGPTKNVTSKIVDLLNSYNIRAVFFFVGNRIKNNKDILSKVSQSNHIIANHTYKHEMNFPVNKPSVMYNSLIKTDSLIRTYINVNNTRSYFRAPGGVWNKWRKITLNSHNSLREYIGPFFWNIGGGKLRGQQDNLKQAADWRCWSKGISPKQCAKGYYNELINYGRGTILMHDINSKSYLMLKNLLRLMHEREGIKNKSDNGFWKFIDLDKNTEINDLEVNNI